MLEKFRNFIIYGGADKESFNAVKSRIYTYNRRMALIFGSLAVALIGIMFILSFSVESLMGTRTVYLIGMIFSVILVTVAMFSKKVPALSYVAVYMAISGFLLYGIAIATLTRPEDQTVTFMVLLMFVPLIFVDRPLNMGICLIAHILLFIIMAMQTKSGAVLSADLADAVIFGILSLVSETVVNRAKIHGYVLEDRLRLMSETDQLTGLNNRNCYEMRFPRYASMYRESICCIYSDANGLHELNNTMGHKAGDEMLRFIGNALCEKFGKNDVYRIGGDEFVVFVMDVPEKEILARLSDLKQLINGQGYRLAVGYTIRSEKNADMDQLMKTAESMMYRDKSEFYKERDARNIRGDYNTGIGQA